MKARFSIAVRSHWAVENSLNWVLDMSMKEDECQIYRGNAAEILSGARKIALNMLRAETTRKISIPRKQMRAHGSTDYQEQVLTAGLRALSDISAFMLSPAIATSYERVLLLLVESRFK